MPLIKKFETYLPLVAELPGEWQKDIALMVGRHAEMILAAETMLQSKYANAMMATASTAAKPK